MNNTEDTLMRHKKKLIFSLVSLIVIVSAFVGGSFAYFTDKVETTNVIVAGSVSIKQHETDRNGVKSTSSYITMVPAVTTDTTTEEKVINGNKYNFNTYKNIIDKVVTVENNGRNDVYVRTIIAIPEINDRNLVGIINNTADIDWLKLEDVDILGKEHTLYVATYKNKLSSGEKSAPSLMQVYLSPHTLSADLATVPEGKIRMHIVSQAVQCAGFEDESALTAFAEGYGDITRYNHPFEDVTV